MTKVGVAGPILVAMSATAPRRRLAEVVRRRAGGVAVLEARGRRDFDVLAVEHQPAVVVLALPLRGFGGLDALRSLRRLSPVSRAIVLSNAATAAAALDALKLGARGYCALTIDPLVLVKAIELVEQGEIWIGRKLMLDLLEEVAPVRTAGRHAEPDCLTAREQQIVDRIGDGASNKEIAEMLSITEKTVKGHLTAIFRKLGVSSRLQLAVHRLEPASEPRAILVPVHQSS